jgi:hypothetical protein
MLTGNLKDLLTLTALGLVSCPGRDAALFALLRRTGIVPSSGVSLWPRLCSAPLRKSYALRCVRGMKPSPKKNPASRRDFPSLTHSPSISSELAVLLTLAALTVRILLLLARLLAAALLLAGLLTRVLILLARILVLVGHSGSPYLRCSECNGKTTREGRALFPKKLRFPLDHYVAQICREYGFGTGQN